MFESKKQKLTLKTYTATADEYGQKVKTLDSTGYINIFISLASKYQTDTNDMRIQQCTHIGISYDTCSVGQIIDDKYEIQFINALTREKIIYLKEIESDGIIP